MYIYSQVNWDKAECKDVYTDLFFSVEEQRNAYAYPFIDAVRSICARCPIWKECLTYAIRYEQYGVWGGLTSIERKSMENPRQYPIQKKRALQALFEYGITLEQIKECYEHKINVGGMAD